MLSCSADHNAANSPLLLLPPEIRCRIYDYAFGGFVIHLTTDDFQRKLILTQALCQSPQTCASLHFQHHRILPMGSKAFEDKCIQSSGDPTIARIKIPVHMLQVCRQIYHEAVLKPFDQTTFHFVTGPRGSGALSIFPKKLVRQQLRSSANLWIVSRGYFPSRPLISQFKGLATCRDRHPLVQRRSSVQHALPERSVASGPVARPGSVQTRGRRRVAQENWTEIRAIYCQHRHWWNSY
jgi:hypothetical protein